MYFLKFFLPLQESLDENKELTNFELIYGNEFQDK